MKLFVSLIMSLAVGFCSSSQLVGQTISVNFAEDDNGTPRQNQTLLSTDVAGVAGYATNNWNNALFSLGSFANLKDNNGLSTSASVSWVAANGWGDGSANTAANAGDPNAKLQRGYIDDTGTGNTATVNVSNIPYQVYDLVLYFSSDGFGELHGSFQINGQSIGNLGTIIAWSDSPTLDLNRNVLVLSGLTESSLQVIGTRNVGVSRGSISGLQIVQVPEPGSAWLGLIGLCGLAVRRRRR